MKLHISLSNGRPFTSFTFTIQAIRIPVPFTSRFCSYSAQRRSRPRKGTALTSFRLHKVLPQVLGTQVGNPPYEWGPIIGLAGIPVPYKRFGANLNSLLLQSPPKLGLHTVVKVSSYVLQVLLEPFGRK